MPKKTKKEKIIAQYRRKLSSFHETAPMPSPYVYQTKTTVSPHTAVTIQPMDWAIRKDLVKTLILAAIAIAGEVALSYIF